MFANDCACYDGYETTPFRKVIDQDFMIEKGFTGGELREQRNYIVGAIDAVLSLDTAMPNHGSAGDALIYLTIPGTSCKMKFVRAAGNLELVRRRAKQIKIGTEKRRQAKRPPKPTGKNPAVIAMEIAEEVDRFHRERDYMRDTYLRCIGEWKERAEAERDKWHDIDDKVMRKEITLKSLTELFNGRTPSHTDLRDRVWRAGDYVAEIEKRAEETRKTIIEGFPALARELGLTAQGKGRGGA